MTKTDIASVMTITLGRDHHDTGGTESSCGETSTMPTLTCWRPPSGPGETRLEGKFG